VVDERVVGVVVLVEIENEEPREINARNATITIAIENGIFNGIFIRIEHGAFAFTFAFAFALLVLAPKLAPDDDDRRRFLVELSGIFFFAVIDGNVFISMECNDWWMDSFVRSLLRLFRSAGVFGTQSVIMCSVMLYRIVEQRKPRQIRLVLLVFGARILAP